MIIADSYPFLEVFWTMLVFFAFVVWLWILFTVIADVLRRHDIGGWGKVGWLAFVIVLPYLGVFVYLIAEHRGMGERAIARQQAAAQDLAELVQKQAGPENPAEQIAQAKTLLDAGTITQADFDRIKDKALAAH